ncbi:PrkA family serine protein kinase, partial [Pseudomonas shirazensis]
MSIFSHFQQRFESTRQEELSLQEYLELCKQDRSAYASAAERLLLAIGEPEVIDTSTNSRLSRIFSNKVIRRYPAFADFHGMEECIDQIVSYFRHAAQGLEEKKQILYLLGPVGGGKSSLAEKLKQLI